MSASSTQAYPWVANSWISEIASCARRPGRNPYEHGWKSASQMGSSTSLRAAWTTRSATVGTDGSYCPSCRGVWGLSLFLVSWCCYGTSMAAGTDIQGRGQRCWRGLVRRAAGLRCPELVMRARQPASVAGVQGMHSLPPGLRRASSCPVSVQ